MRLLYAQGFSNSERDDFRCIIFSNVLNAVKLLCQAMEVYELQFEYEDNEQHAALLSLNRELERGEPWPLEYLTPFKHFWRDSGVQKAVSRGHEFALHDNLQYYFDSIDRLFGRSYIPTDQDCLRARLKTTGITESKFAMGAFTYRMFDVGGQRSERKKWIHCFDSVHCLLFLVAVSGYNDSLIEDPDANQTHEALMLFDSIINSQWFRRTAVILFLNKIDRFREKMPKYPLVDYFPDYQGSETDIAAGQEYFKRKFLALNRNPNKVSVTRHERCAAAQSGR